MGRWVYFYSPLPTAFWTRSNFNITKWSCAPILSSKETPAAKPCKTEENVVVHATLRTVVCWYKLAASCVVSSCRKYDFVRCNRHFFIPCHVIFLLPAPSNEKFYAVVGVFKWFVLQHWHTWLILLGTFHPVGEGERRAEQSGIPHLLDTDGEGTSRQPDTVPGEICKPLFHFKLFEQLLAQWHSDSSKGWCDYFKNIIFFLSYHNSTIRIVLPWA